MENMEVLEMLPVEQIHGEDPIIAQAFTSTLECTGRAFAINVDDLG